MLDRGVLGSTVIEDLFSWAAEAELQIHGK